MRYSTASQVALTLAILLTGCTEGGTGPSPEPPVYFQVVSGGDQQAGPGEELPDPLVVQAVDDNGRPLRDQLVNFRVVEGGGSVWAGAAQTDRGGMARDYWTLGESGTQRVEVRAVDPTTGEKRIFGEFTAVLLLPDVDGDGHDMSVDCDDNDPSTHPGAPELADGRDNDCDGQVDEGLSPEVCDGIDNDGDGLVDEGFPYCIAGQPAPNTDGSACNEGWHDLDGDLANGCESDSRNVSTWYRDADADGYGDPADWIEAELAPPGYVGNPSDCDDSDAATHPGATELADQVDNDCDGEVDEPLTPSTGDLVITELMIDPAVIDDADCEWIELYNASGSNLELFGLGVLVESGVGPRFFRIEASVMLAPGEHAVLARNGATGVNGGVAADYGYDSTVELPNTGARVSIGSAGGTLLDAVLYGPGDVQIGASTLLCPAFYDPVANDAMGNWSFATVLYDPTSPNYGTPGTINVCP